MSGNGGSQVDTTMETVGWLWTIPTKLQYNPYNPSNFSWATWQFSFEAFGNFDLKAFLKNGEKKWMPRAAKSWDIPDSPAKGDTITLTVPDDRTWHNGDPVTPDDLYTKLRLEYFFDAVDYGWLDPDSLKKTDNGVQIKLSKSVNPDILKKNLLPKRLDTKHSIYKEHLNNLEEAEKQGEEAMKKAKNKFTSFSPKEPVGTGFLKFDKNTSQRTILKPFEDHPIGKKAPYKQWSMDYITTNQQKWELALGNEVDLMESGTPKNMVNKIRDKGYEMARFHYLGGMAYQFNQGFEPFSDHRVRQAIAYAINREAANIPVKGPWGQVRTHVETPTAIFVGEDNWLSQDFKSKMNSYSPTSVDTEMVDKKMREAGYTKQDGKWAKNGEVLQIPMKIHGGYSEFVKASNTVKENLTQAGFSIEMISLSSTKMGTQMDSGDYKFCTGGWGNGWHPYDGYRLFLPNYWRVMNIPAEIEAPPVGNADGSPQTYNVEELMSSLATSTSTDEAKGLVKELAWVYNQTVPQVPIWRRYGQMFLNNKWNWNLDEWDTYLQNAVAEVFRRGLVDPKTE